jgi:hypothetical protein
MNNNKPCICHLTKKCAYWEKNKDNNTLYSGVCHYPEKPECPWYLTKKGS